jgi:hypothetical protein
MVSHGLECLCGIPSFDGLKDTRMVFDGGLLSDAADGAQSACDAQFREGIEDEPVDQIATGVGNGVVGRDVRLDCGDVVRGVLQLVLNAPQCQELFLGCALRCKRRGVGFDGVARFIELLEPFSNIGKEQGEGIVEGTVELVDDLDAIAVRQCAESVSVLPICPAHQYQCLRSLFYLGVIGIVKV